VGIGRGVLNTERDTSWFWDFIKSKVSIQPSNPLCKTLQFWLATGPGFSQD
jgi:hypothetical protein